LSRVSEIAAYCSLPCACLQIGRTLRFVRRTPTAAGTTGRFDGLALCDDAQNCTYNLSIRQGPRRFVRKYSVTLQQSSTRHGCGSKEENNPRSCLSYLTKALDMSPLLWGWRYRVHASTANNGLAEGLRDSGRREAPFKFRPRGLGSDHLNKAFGFPSHYSPLTVGGPVPLRVKASNEEIVHMKCRWRRQIPS
jgi:hypothetical protein